MGDDPRIAAGGSTPMASKQARLVLLCGLPASGKTTLARELADAYGAVRLNTDEWKLALGIDPFDEDLRVRLETELWALAQRLLALGTAVILEWGFWARSERDEKRDFARSLVDRHANGGLAITESHMERYRVIFEPPTDEESSLYDPPLERGVS
jgi:predicted kinase